jgi:hypothetical protein
MDTTRPEPFTFRIAAAQGYGVVTPSGAVNWARRMAPPYGTTLSKSLMARQPP